LAPKKAVQAEYFEFGEKEIPKALTEVANTVALEIIPEGRR
jgi:hypothetical protein